MCNRAPAVEDKTHLAPGKNRIVIDFKYEGEGLASPSAAFAASARVLSVG